MKLYKYLLVCTLKHPLFWLSVCATALASALVYVGSRGTEMLAYRLEPLSIAAAKEELKPLMADPSAPPELKELAAQESSAIEQAQVAKSDAELALHMSYADELALKRLKITPNPNLQTILEVHHMLLERMSLIPDIRIYSTVTSQGCLYCLASLFQGIPLILWYLPALCTICVCIWHAGPTMLYCKLPIRSGIHLLIFWLASTSAACLQFLFGLIPMTVYTAFTNGLSTLNYPNVYSYQGALYTNTVGEIIAMSFTAYFCSCLLLALIVCIARLQRGLEFALITSALVLACALIFEQLSASGQSTWFAPALFNMAYLAGSPHYTILQNASPAFGPYTLYYLCTQPLWCALIFLSISILHIFKAKGGCYHGTCA